MEQEISCLDPYPRELWHASAGPLVKIPSVNSTVFYFPQGHAEHAHAPPDFHAPRVPPLILCRVVAVKFLADAETDEVFTKITLLPLPGNDLVLANDAVVRMPEYVVKTLTHSDVVDGGLSLLRWHADIFPQLDYGTVTPVQTITAKDIHGETWKFRHIYSGKSRRHLLTKGWSTYVNRKKLIAGDAIVFFRSESGGLFLGSRRANVVIAPGKVTVEAVAEAVARASCGQEFEVVYYPRAGTPEYIVKAADVSPAMRIRWCSGMRIEMDVETDDFRIISSSIGTVSDVQVADPIRWPNSPWRLLEVVWDKTNLLQDVKRVSPWQVTLLSDDIFSFQQSHISNRKRLRVDHLFDGVSSDSMDGGGEMTLTGTVDSQDVMRKLRKHWPMFEPSEKLESEKSRSKQHMNEDEELAFAVANSLRDVKRFRPTEALSDSGSGSIILDVADKPTTKSFKLLGVSCETMGGGGEMTMTGTMDSQDVMRKLNKHWPMFESSEKLESEKSRSKQHMNEDAELGLAVANSLRDVKRSRPTEALGGSGSGSIILNVADKPTTIPFNMTNPSYPKDEWYFFCEFLGNRLPPLNISGCKAEDVIDYLRMQQDSSNVDALVGRLSAACELFGIKPQDNPFHSVAVTAYLRAAREMTRETECILVFSCNNSHDVDETHFIKAILKELHDREVIPLTFNLSGRDNLDAGMLCRSSVGIMVLSNSYTCSRQSLDHLVEIMEQGKTKNLVIIPIYFKVTHSDICGLEGRFEAAFLQYVNSAQPGRVQKWKAAMVEIASIDGHEWTKETQVILAQEVVRSACLRLYLKNSKNLVRILTLLNPSQPSDADIVGIWGMAGIGKTSIATEIFGSLAPQYDLCYFLQDFYLMCQKKGLRQMRDDFYSKVFGEEKLSIGASDVKPSFMRDWFHRKTILVVLDDVSNARDVEAVIGGFGWFSHGHRIILTSRQKQVLVQCKVKEPYEIQKLCETESFRLCKQYLSGESAVISDIMSCSSGIPLALKVLGSSLSKQHINNRMEHLQKLRRNPPSQIQETFRRSFDGLDENEKNIFLDLACFFRGEKMDHVVQLLDACGFLTYLGICDLIDESLISLLDNRIEIPIPFQDIGRFIVNEEDEDPCERSRLWDSNDIADVLTNNSGTEAIEGIFLDASDLKCELSPIVLSKMHRLRLLKFYCSTSGNDCKLSLPQGLDTLPDELRLLHWENYPLKYLPQKFNPENLVEVNMPYSHMEKLWEGNKNLMKLKKIKLSHSKYLTDILLLSEAMNLEHIDLEGCSSLVDVSTSIPRSGKLVSLNMKDCSHLRCLPSMVDLTSLKLLNMSGCSELEEIQDFAPTLKELYLAGTAITELPLSVENLTELVMLDLENCRKLQQLPRGIRNSRSIVELKLSGCTSLGLSE